MNIIVQKFGGSSVATVEKLEQVAEHIINKKKKKNQVVVVVSAQGKTTDKLISEAKKILLEKYNINMNEKNIDEKVRFILGKCNPIILVPGIFSTRLSIKIYCKKLYEKDKDFLKKMRVFCMDNLCKNINEEKEEETLFLRFFDLLEF